MEPERAELELAGAEADPEPEPEKRNGGRWRRTLMASRLLFSPDSFYQIVAQLFSLFFCVSCFAPSSSGPLIELDFIAHLEATDLMGDQLGRVVQRHQDRVALQNL